MRRLFISTFFLMFCSGSQSFEYHGPYSKYQIQSISDLYEICESLENPDSADKDSPIKAHTCLSYFSGILVGYTSTISLGAEFELAKNSGTKRSEIATKIDSDEALHNQLTQITNENHFICMSSNINHTALAIDVMRKLKRKNTDPSYSPHYFVLNEIIEHVNCAKAQ